ncbi:MAG TPA: hypothetical protein VMC10_09800 [Stellaceae bacterium]|nr:hypothetical protein [Stellaceae bacterium]
MLDTDFIRGRASHYRHLARGTDDQESLETLLSLAEVCAEEADLLEHGLPPARPRPGPG